MGIKVIKMKIFDYDRLRITSDSEYGTIPKGRGIETYRWDGNKLIDLLTLNEFYVDNKFILHSIEVPYSQLVSMDYNDRQKLWNDNGTYKIKTDEQIITEKNMEFRVGHYPKISDQIAAIMKYLATKNDLPDELQSLVNKIEAVKIIYPKPILKEIIK